MAFNDPPKIIHVPQFIRAGMDIFGKVINSSILPSRNTTILDYSRFSNRRIFAIFFIIVAYLIK